LLGIGNLILSFFSSPFILFIPGKKAKDAAGTPVQDDSATFLAFFAGDEEDERG